MICEVSDYNIKGTIENVGLKVFLVAMNKLVNEDQQNFLNYIDPDYQDKSLLILETNKLLNNNNSKFICVTRPRRFGKSLAVAMLNAYYSKGANTKELFSKLKVSQYSLVSTIDPKKDFLPDLQATKDVVKNDQFEKYKLKQESRKREIYRSEDFTEHLNKYDVIKFEFNSVIAQYNSFKKDLFLLEEAKALYQELVINNPEITLPQVTSKLTNFSIFDYLKYSIIKELRTLYPNLISSSHLIDLPNVLKIIAEKNNSKFIFLIDEWDVIFRDPPYNTDQNIKNEYVNFLRSLFKDEQLLTIIALVYITGILPIQRYYSESSLNNFREYSMLDTGELSSYFGFLKSEVKALCKQYKRSFNEITHWYDGYYIENNHLYNPYSVITSLRSNKCKNYWIKTSASSLAFDYIFGNAYNSSPTFLDIQNDFVNMMLGEEITADLDSFDGNPFNIHSKEQLYTLLVCLGYLTIKPPANNKSHKNCVIKIPNLEIADALRKEMINHKDDTNANGSIKRLFDLSNGMYKAITETQDQELVANIVQDFHNDSVENVSFKEYNDESALRFTIQTLLLFATADRYRVEKESASGLGFVDLIYLPINNELPIIIEFKLDHSADQAIEQIKERDYMQRIKKLAKHDQACIVGIAYSSKTKKHQCKIEIIDLQ